MKYYICTNDGSTIHIVKEITKEEYAQWRKCTEQLKYYSMAKHFRDMAIQNGLEIEQLLKDIRATTDPSVIRQVNAKAVAQKANRLMLNYLVSFRTYVDNLQAYAKHIKNGKQFKTEILSWIYDNERIYAFLYRLRNFATHFSLIFDKATIELDYFDIQCSKEHLLEFKEWKQTDKDYINSCPGDAVPLLECVEHLNVLLMSIYLGFIQCFAEDIQEMHSLVMPLMHEYQILNPFFIECEDIKDLAGAHLLGLGLHILKEATDEFAQLPNVNINYVTPGQVLNGDI